jgi:hypothetical protein
VKLHTNRNTLVFHQEVFYAAQTSVGIAVEMFIKLNVGGETFQTTKETLLSEPNSLFHHILNGSWGVERDSYGAILLDRDPRYVPQIGKNVTYNLENKII